MNIPFFVKEALVNSINIHIYNVRWWKDLYGDIKLEYARDRIVECYFWSYSCLYEEEYARSRIVLAKLLKLVSLLDDTYDEHAALEECRVLTKAIERLVSLFVNLHKQNRTFIRRVNA